MSNYAISLILYMVGSLFIHGSASADSQANSNHTDSANSLQYNTALIIGASYAKNWEIKKFADHNVINKSVSGSETGQMLYRIKADIQETNPKVVIMWGFINDIFRSAPDNLNEKINNIKQNIISIVEICKVEGVTPLLATEVTITTRNTWKEKVMTVIGKLRGKESYSDYINKHVIETNNWLRSYANKNNIIILDFEKVLSDENGERKREYATEDGSHLSKRAYEALNEYMRVFDSMQHSK